MNITGSVKHVVNITESAGVLLIQPLLHLGLATDWPSTTDNETNYNRKGTTRQRQRVLHRSAGWVSFRDRIPFTSCCTHGSFSAAPAAEASSILPLAASSGWTTFHFKIKQTPARVGGVSEGNVKDIPKE